MGTKTESYCDNCGDSVGNATLQDAVQISALGTSGLPSLIYLCVKPEFKDPMNENDAERLFSRPRVPKITGCARKVLTKSVLTTLYDEVQKYTGDESDKPFHL